MKGRFPRRIAAGPARLYCTLAATVALPALFSGCVLFRPAPPPSALAPGPLHIPASVSALAHAPSVPVPAPASVPAPVPTPVPANASAPPSSSPAAVIRLALQETTGVPAVAPEQEPPVTATAAPSRAPHRQPIPRKLVPPPPPSRAVVASALPSAPAIALRNIDRATTRTLLDSNVQRPDGRVIGQAVDLVVNASGRPVQIVVNLQGFGGVGDRKASFAWNIVHVNTGQKAPTPAITLALAPGQPATDRAQPATASLLPMLDALVERPDGTEVGRIVDVLLGSQAVPQAVVLDISGNVLRRRRTIAVDWAGLRFALKNGTLRPLLDLPDAQINAAPPYAENQPVRAVSAVSSPIAAPSPANARAPAAASDSLHGRASR